MRDILQLYHQCAALVVPAHADTLCATGHAVTHSLHIRMDDVWMHE